MRTQDDDATLVAAAQSGDVAAVEVLLERHHDRLRAVCAKIVGRGPDADDAAQIALISIVKNLHRYDGRAKFTTWSYRIATNAAIDELRKHQRRRAETIDDPLNPIQLEASGDHVLQTTAAMVVRDGLEELDEDFRVPVVLRDLAGLDYAEISDVLNVPVGTVKSRIARGRGKLATLIGTFEENGNKPTRGNVKGGEDA